MIVTGGFFVGFLVGMTGVGAGSLMTPFLITQVGVPPTLAVGTDLLFAGLTKASAATRHHNFGNVNWPIVRWLAAGSVPGAIAMLALLSFLDPDMAAIARIIKASLAGALVLSSLAILLYPVIAKERMQMLSESADTPPRPFPTVLLGLEAWAAGAGGAGRRPRSLRRTTSLAGSCSRLRQTDHRPLTMVVGRRAGGAGRGARRGRDGTRGGWVSG